METNYLNDNDNDRKIDHEDQAIGCLYGTLGIVAIVAFIIGSLFGKLFL